MKKSIISSAIILTCAGIITRILGFVYRIYMSNMIGAEGMGLYQLIMPIYGLAWSLACSGFTTTISKLTAQEKAKGEYGNMRRLLRQSVIFTTLTGVVIAFVIFYSAELTAVVFFKDTRTTMSLQILAFAIPFMSAGSCIRGYFYGLQETMIPAINQVFEQCVRMLVVFLLAGTFMPLGLEFACATALVGIVAEECFSFIFAFVAYKRSKVRKLYKKPSITRGKSLMMLLTMAIPLTANRVIGSLLATFENILIPLRLQAFGMSSKEAISAFGQITGMAMPLIYFPSAFLMSLAISLVPAVSEASAMRNFQRIKYTASKSILFSSVIGFGAAAIFIVFANELGQVIYNQDISLMLILLGIMCPFLYIQVVLSGILNGLGYQVFIFRNSLISSVINIGFIYFLVPKQGMNGFIIGWFVSLIIICGIEIQKLRQSVELNFEFKNWFLKPVISAIATALTIKYLANKLVFNFFGDKLGLAIAITLLVMVYGAFIILTGCLSRDELFGALKRKQQ